MAFVTATRYLMAVPNTTTFRSFATEAEAVAYAQTLVNDLDCDIHIIPSTTISYVQE